MKLRDRLKRITYVPHKNVLIGGDIYGRIHCLDENLNLIASSPTPIYKETVMGLTVSEKYVFTRDVYGNLSKYDLETLSLLDVVPGDGVVDRDELEEEEEPYWTSSRLCIAKDGKLYVLNGFGQIVEYDEETMSALRILDVNHEAFVDCLELSHPHQQAICDYGGNIRLGNLEKGTFGEPIRIKQGPMHSIRYDERHDRYWFTTDDGGCFGTMDTDGGNLVLHHVTNDDVECIEFAHDFRTAYISCFDHYIYVFDNTEPEIRMLRKIGPFKYQTTTVIYAGENQIYTLLQSGEVIRFNDRGEVLAQHFEGNTVWALEAVPGDDSLVYAAMEDGSVRMIRYGIGSLGDAVIEEVGRHDHCFGRLRQAKPFADGSYVAISALGYVFRVDERGGLVWQRRFEGIGRGLDESADGKKLLIATDYGMLALLDIETGDVLEQRLYKKPIWAVSYAGPNKEKIVVAFRKALAHVYSEELELEREIQLTGNIKRLKRLENGHVLVHGGEVREINPFTGDIVRHFTGATVNTVESLMPLNGFLFCVTYSMQISSYQFEDMEIVGYSREMPDYPKTIIGRMTEDGTALLLCGGRGGYLRCYKADEEGLTRLLRQKILKRERDAHDRTAKPAIRVQAETQVVS